MLDLCLTFAQSSAISAAQSAQQIDRPFATFVAEASEKFSIPDTWIFAVMTTESANNDRAISNKGAMGLMQLMPATWQALRKTYGLGDDPFDPRSNILAGAAYLRELYDRYGLHGFLAAYNAGPGRYEASRKPGGTLPLETRSYVKNIETVLGIDDHTMFALSPSPIVVRWTEAPIFSLPQDRSGLTPLPSVGPENPLPATGLFPTFSSASSSDSSQSAEEK